MTNDSRTISKNDIIRFRGSLRKVDDENDIMDKLKLISVRRKGAALETYGRGRWFDRTTVEQNAELVEPGR